MKKNKNSLSNLYNELNHSFNSQITNIVKKTKMTSNIGNFIIKYKTITIILTILYLILVILAFNKSQKLILYSILLALFIIIISTLNSTYKLEMTDDSITIKHLNDTLSIPYKTLYTIVFTRDKTRLSLIPIYTYKILIISIQDNQENIISLPVIMLKTKQLKDFMNSFKYEIDEQEENREKQNIKKKEKLLLKIFITISTIIIIIAIIATIYTIIHRK